MHLRPVLHLLCVACALLGCQHDADVAPAPACYSGVILGESCPDGTLIQVDTYPIGKAVVPYKGYLNGVPAPDSIGTSNLIAAVNSPAPTLKRGQRIYFTYQNDPQPQLPPWQCYVFGALAIPRFVLSNVSSAPCNAL